MPSSDPRLRPWILRELQKTADLSVFHNVVDIGSGCGEWSVFLRPHTPHAYWTGVEIWEPYVAMFGLESKYDKLVIGDARTVELPEADLYIFGDVLEHMPADEALTLWNKARKLASWLVINLPVIRYEQGALYGNQHEIHVCHWDEPSVLAAFPGIFSHTGPPEPGSVVGAFIAEGTCASLPSCPAPSY